VYGIDDDHYVDVEASRRYTSESLRSFEPDHVVSLCGKCGFESEELGCDRQGQTEEQLDLPVDCTQNEGWEGNEVNGVVEVLDVHIFKARGLLVDQFEDKI